MSKIKELTYSLKKGLPNYSSVSAGMTVEIEEGDNLTRVWEDMKREIMGQCNEEAAWINKKQSFEEPIPKGGETE